MESERMGGISMFHTTWANWAKQHLIASHAAHGCAQIHLLSLQHLHLLQFPSLSGPGVGCSGSPTLSRLHPLVFCFFCQLLTSSLLPKGALYIHGSPCSIRLSPIKLSMHFLKNHSSGLMIVLGIFWNVSLAHFMQQIPFNANKYTLPIPPNCCLKS